MWTAADAATASVHKFSDSQFSALGYWPGRGLTV